MLRPAVLASILALATGCNSGGEILLVTRPEPPPGPRTQRVELREVAAVASEAVGKKVELWLPLVSDEPGVQVVELMSARIEPSLPYAIESDGSGNRLLHLRARGPVTVTIDFRVRRTESCADLSLVEDRELTPDERRRLAGELGGASPRDRGAGVSWPALVRDAVGRCRDEASKLDADTGWRTELARLRGSGVPARVVSGLVVRDQEPAPAIGSWLEAFLPGLAWTPALRDTEVGVLPAAWVAVTRGDVELRGRATLDGAAVSPRVSFAARLLPDP